MQVFAKGVLCALNLSKYWFCTQCHHGIEIMLMTYTTHVLCTPQLEFLVFFFEACSTPLPFTCMFFGTLDQWFSLIDVLIINSLPSRKDTQKGLEYITVSL